MGIPLWGREDIVERIASSPRSTSRLIRLVGPEGAGLARIRSALIEALEGAGSTVSVAIGDPLAAVTPGAIGEQLGDIDDADVVVVGSAHLADGTSLGRLARRLGSERPVLIVIDHPPVNGLNALALDRLAASRPHSETVTIGRITADDVATSLDIETDTARVLLDAAKGRDDALSALLTELGQTQLDQPESLAQLLAQMASAHRSRFGGLPRDQRALLELVTAADRTVSTRVAAAALQIEPDAVLDAGESLARDGQVVESAAGFGPPGEPRRSELQAELGLARRAHALQTLAHASEELGDAVANPAATGLDFFAAEEWDRAYAHLLDAATKMMDQGALAEAYPIISAALRCQENGVKADDSDIASLLYGRARFYRDAGYPALAAEDLDQAAALATGPSRIDILGFKAAALDDQQLPQAAETTVATAEYEAASHGAIEKLGSLLTFRARELSRLGFAAEADHALDVGTALLASHGTAAQQQNATRNRAWMAFDRGNMGSARHLFENLTTTQPKGDDLAWSARAQFGSGRAIDALDSITRAEAIGLDGADHVVRFLTAIARAEGALAYGRPEAAIQAADEELSLVTLLLPNWENGTHYRRAAAHSQMGDWEGAAEAIELAHHHTPPGADGRRWGARIEALRHVIDHARTGEWDATAAEALTDDLMVANWFGAAVDLMIDRATIEHDTPLGLDAAALAMHLGNPMAAARAVHAAGAWDHEDAAEVAAGIRQARTQVPDDWIDDWSELPHVRAALAIEPVDLDPRLEQRLERALDAAGLANADSMYSPAQRAARGLGRRRPAPQRRSRLAWVGIAAAAIAVAALAGFLGSRIGDDPQADGVEPVVITAAAPPQSAPTTTIPLPLEQTILPAPDDLVGQAPYLGGPALNAVFDATGVPELGGIYWQKTTGGPTRSAPVVVGDTIVVGGGDGFVWFVDTTDGSSTRQRMSARIDAPVASGELLIGSGPESTGRERALVAADNSGSVVALRPAGTTIWESEVGAAVTAAPIITDEAVVVATADGTIHGLSSGEGDEIWRYPGESDEPLGSIESSLAVADGIVFAFGRSGAVGIDIATGELRCSDPLGTSMSAASTVADGYVYTPNGPTVHVMSTGCNVRLDGGQAAIQMNVETVTSPVIVGETMYIGSNRLLAGFSVIDGSEVMGLDLGSQITGSPVVADDIIYAGTADGLVYAADRHTSEVLWKFDTGEAIDAPVAVIDDAVFVLTSAGRLIAIGG